MHLGCLLCSFHKSYGVSCYSRSKTLQKSNAVNQLNASLEDFLKISGVVAFEGYQLLVHHAEYILNLIHCLAYKVCSESNRRLLLKNIF